LETTKKINPAVFGMLKKVLNQMVPQSISGLSHNDLIKFIVDEVKYTSDRAGLPIIRFENKFFIFKDGEPFPLSNKELELFFVWVGKKLEIPEDTFFYGSFRDQLFGRGWRELEGEK
jgi:hypothetical protein